jgi:hypothetical protein
LIMNSRRAVHATSARHCLEKNLIMNSRRAVHATPARH